MILLFLLFILNLELIKVESKCVYDEYKKTVKVSHTEMKDRYCRFRKRCMRMKQGMFRKFRFEIVYHDMDDITPK